MPAAPSARRDSKSRSRPALIPSSRENATACRRRNGSAPFAVCRDAALPHGSRVLFWRPSTHSGTPLAFCCMRTYAQAMRAALKAIWRSGLWLSALACTPSASGAIDPRPSPTTTVEMEAAGQSAATRPERVGSPTAVPASSSSADREGTTAREASDEELMATMLGEPQSAPGGTVGTGVAGAGVGVTVAAAPSGASTLEAPPVVRESRDFRASPGLAPEVIRRVIRQQFGFFRACYSMGLAKQPQLAGTLAFDFKIDGHGVPSDVTRGRAPIADSKVVECVASRFPKLLFPIPTVAPISVHFALEFMPARPAKAEASRP